LKIRDKIVVAVLVAAAVIGLASLVTGTGREGSSGTNDDLPECAGHCDRSSEVPPLLQARLPEKGLNDSVVEWCEPLGTSATGYRCEGYNDLGVTSYTVLLNEGAQYGDPPMIKTWAIGG
jgi:hypothetical protein